MLFEEFSVMKNFEKVVSEYSLDLASRHVGSGAVLHNNTQSYYIKQKKLISLATFGFFSKKLSKKPNAVLVFAD